MNPGRLDAWPQIEARLALGPSTRAALAVEVYGEVYGRRPTAGPACGGLLRTLIGRGLVVRVGLGWYALPGTPRLLPTIGDFIALLAAHRCTMREAATRLAVSIDQIGRWARRLIRLGPVREDGAVIRIARAPHNRWAWHWNHTARRWHRTPVYIYWLGQPLKHPHRVAPVGRPLAIAS